MKDPFSIKIDSFEGPLAVLLSMVEKHKLHPSDVPLAKVTEEYVAYVKEREIPPEELSEFILVAATLMLIKSRSLLPKMSLTSTEEASIEELEQRVSEYQKIQERALVLAELLSKPGYAKRQRSAEAQTELAPSFRPPEKTPLHRDTLRDTIQKLIQRMPVREEIPQTVVKKIKTLEEVLTALIERVARSLKTDLHEFAGADRHNIILSFLAILELAKQGNVSLSQAAHFSPITIETAEYSTPRYT